MRKMKNWFREPMPRDVSVSQQIAFMEHLQRTESPTRQMRMWGIRFEEAKAFDALMVEAVLETLRNVAYERAVMREDVSRD